MFYGSFLGASNISFEVCTGRLRVHSPVTHTALLALAILTEHYYHHAQLQPDQINMAVLFWYLGKSDASVQYSGAETYTGQVTFKKVPETHAYV